MSGPPPVLSLIETRILGVLYEKQHTVPDIYPLSLNALVAGCNQKTSRHPVMEVRESEVLDALDNLRRSALVIETSGGRVTRYAHNLDRVYRVPSQALALLTVLMLRGPQTAAELRLNCERLHRFADISAAEAFLEELATRPEGALVVLLPRQPGARESRWGHLLAGPVDLGSMLETGETSARSDPGAGEDRVTDLEDRVAKLEQAVAELLARLGSGPMATPPSPEPE